MYTKFSIKVLRADVCKIISTRGGENKIFQKSQTNYVHSPRYSSHEIEILVSLDKYFGYTTNVNFRRLTASARPLFRAPRPGYEKTTISIELKYHPTQKASYRIKRGYIHILSGDVLELIATGIFYGFLNIYKILRLLREQNIVRFQRPKITSDT